MRVGEHRNFAGEPNRLRRREQRRRAALRPAHRVRPILGKEKGAVLEPEKKHLMERPRGALLSDRRKALF